MKLNLNFQFKNLAGTEIRGDGGHAGKNLAQVLYQSNVGDSLKFSSWAIKLFNSPHCIELDRTDKDVLVGFLETVNKTPNTNLQISNGIAGALIEAIKDQWEKAEKKVVKATA